MEPVVPPKGVVGVGFVLVMQLLASQQPVKPGACDTSWFPVCETYHTASIAQLTFALLLTASSVCAAFVWSIALNRS